MKKVLAAGAALMMTAAFASTAAAEVNFGGDARARIFLNDSYAFGNTVQPDGTLDNKTSQGFSSRVRLQFRGKAAGGAYAVGRLRLNDLTWNGPQNASDSKNIWADKAYIGIPMGDATLEAGYTQITVSRFTIDDIDMAGGKLIYKTGGFTALPFFFWNRDGQFSDNPFDVVNDNDDWNAGLVLMGTVADAWNIGAAAWFRNDDTGQELDGDTGDIITEAGDDGWVWTVFGNGSVAGFTVAGEFAWASSDYQNTVDDGYGGYIEAGYAMDALTAKLTAAFTFDGYVPDGDFGDITGWIMFGGGSAINVTGFERGFDMQAYGAHVGYAISESLSVRGNVVYANYDANDNLGIDVNRFAHLWEISGGLKYVISEGADVDIVAGYLQPDFDGRIDGTPINDDGAFGAAATFGVKF